MASNNTAIVNNRVRASGLNSHAISFQNLPLVCYYSHTYISIHQGCIGEYKMVHKQLFLGLYVLPHAYGRMT